MFKLDKMTKSELAASYWHLDNIVILRDNIFPEREEGREEGRKEGEYLALCRLAANLKQQQLSPEKIAKITGLSL